jgi:hypothetical protein
METHCHCRSVASPCSPFPCRGGGGGGVGIGGGEQAGCAGDSDGGGCKKDVGL